MLSWDDEARRLDLGVRDLAEALSGSRDLAPEMVRTLAARARAGREAHQAWQAERSREDDGFRREVGVSWTAAVRGWTCRVTGRVDGLGREGDRLVVEEVKTSVLDGARLARLRWDDVPAWVSQLHLYLFLVGASGAGDPLGRLVLVSLADGSRHAIDVPPDPDVGRRVLDWLDALVVGREALLADRRRRRASAVPFPHDVPRAGQSEGAERIRTALEAGRRVLLVAPTGAGKTAVVLQAALGAAFAEGGRLFFATARNTQQALALQTLRLLAGRGLPLRALGLRARARSCPAGLGGCDPEICPFAVDYHVKVRDGRLVEHVLDLGIVDPDALEALAVSAGVCPHALSMDVLERSDAVVGDYNYVFDPQVRLRRCFGEGADPWIVVVDEAHNLPDRARDWLSPSLDANRLEDAARALREVGEDHDPFAELADAVLDAVLDARGGATFPDGTQLVEPDLERFRALRDRMDTLAPSWALLAWDRRERGLPRPRRLEGDEREDPYLAVSRDLLRFTARLEAAGDETVVLLAPEGPVLRLWCRDPSAWLGACFEGLAGSVCQSATLDPEVHGALLGLDGEAVDLVRLPPVFDPARLAVVVAPGVSTRYRHRGRDRVATAGLLDRVVAAVPGNVAVLFPSFEHRDQVAGLLRLEGRRPLVQERGMDDAVRERILLALRRRRLDAPPCVLLGVLGGVFAEGVDLPGDALLGVVVVGPALPAVTPEQELVRAWFHARTGDGFRTAYLVPGMTRVVQAAGRVVRTETDLGVVVLVDQRFLQHEYARCFPSEWTPIRSARPWEEVARFFEDHAPGAVR